MTWARTRTRANNVSYVKQDSMGIGANAAARVEREHSSNNAAIEKAQAELRQEVFLREKRRKELEFLERGGNPLDFEYGDALPSQLSISIADLLLSDCDPKERKLFLLQNKHLNGIPELWKGLEVYTPFRGPDIPGSKGQGASDTQLTKSSRNADCCDQAKQVLRRGTLPSIVRVKEEKNVAICASLQDSKAESGAVISGNSVTTEGTAEKSSETHCEPPTTAISPKEETYQREQKTCEKETDDSRGNTALPCGLPEKAKDISFQDQSVKAVSICERPSKTEDEILEAAKAIQVGRICAAKKPLQSPARRKSHWDFVLEEMAWMANDFMQERLWKTSAAAHICRSAAQATFWSRGKALAESKKKDLVKQETLELDHDKVLCEKTTTETQSRLPLENYAFRFLSNGVEPLPLKAPCTPEVEERVSISDDPFYEELHFVLPHGASEAYKTSVEESWASKLATYDSEMQRQGLFENESEPEDEPTAPFHLKSIGVKQESDYFDQAAINRKKRKLLLKANADTQSEFLDEESSDVLENYGTIPVKRQRTAAVSGRQREKKSKKGKPSRARSMNKGTDSENEWLPEACEPEKPKRKRDQLFGHRMTKLSKLSNEHASERFKKTSLRKGDFLHVSINQPGNGIPWTTTEDQAIVVLEHDFGSNWELLCDILNAGSHIKGHFRSPKDCKERHMLLLEHLPINRSSGDPGVPGIPKGSAMMYLQRMQGPMEEDTIKFHFEQIVKAKQGCPQMQPEYQRERLQPHESHVDLVSQIYNTHHRFLSPLDFPDDRGAQSGIQKNDQARSKLGVAPAPSRTSATQDHNRSSGEFPEDAPTVANGQTQQTSWNMQGVGKGNDSRATSGAASLQKQQPVQRANLEDRKVPRQMNNGKQEAFHRIASWKEENAKIEQQHRMQQSQQMSSEKRDNLPHKPEAPVQQQQQHAKLVMQPVPDSRPSLQERGVPRQNFQPGMPRKSAQLPPCSTSQQHQEPAVQPIEQHQHPQLQPGFPRAPQPNSTGIGMQQQPNIHYNNHRCFSSFAPPPVWRPAQNSPGIYNQMTCLNQVGPSSVDAAAFQQPRFQNPRSMKHAGSQRPPSQQTQCGMPYMGGSPVPGPVRYQSFSGAQPSYHTMYPGKTWQQQPQPRGGNVADRPTLPASTSNCLGSASSTTEAPDGSCK